MSSCNSEFLLCVYICTYLDQGVPVCKYKYSQLLSVTHCVRVGILRIHMYTYVSSLLVWPNYYVELHTVHHTPQQSRSMSQMDMFQMTSGNPWGWARWSCLPRNSMDSKTSSLLIQMSFMHATLSDSGWPCIQTTVKHLQCYLLVLPAI